MPDTATPAVPLHRVPTGIEGLDTITGGGFLKSGVYILQGSPGAGKTILANHIGFRRAAEGGHVVYVTMLAESHARLMQHLRSFEFFDESLIPERVYFVSAFNALRENGLRGVVDLLRTEMRARKADLLVLDGMVIAADVASSDEAVKLFVSEIQSHSALVGCTTLLLTSDDADRPVSAEQTMVDGILLLRERAFGPRRERQLDVVKFRGSATIRGTHAFTIGRRGIQVHPRLEAVRRESPGAAVRPVGLSTGVPGLDAMFAIGGYARNGVTAVTGNSAAGKTTLGLHFLRGCSAAEPGLWFGFYESPEFLLDISRMLGIDLGPLKDQGHLHFVWQPFGENLLDDLAQRLLDAIERTGARRVVVDGLGGFAIATDYPARDGSFVAALANALRLSGATSLVTLEEQGPSSTKVNTDAPTLSAVADTAVYMELDARQGDRTRRRLWIGKSRISRFDTRIRELRLTDTGLEVARDAAQDAVADGTAARADDE